MWNMDEDRPRTPDFFDVFEALGKGYSFLWFQRRLLARMAAIPALFVFITGVLVVHLDMDMNPLRGFLVQLPQSFVQGWYFFATARLALMGERIEALPGDPAFLAARRQAMSASILIFLVFNAAAAAITTLLLAGENGPPALDLALRLLSIPLLVALVWGVRYVTLYMPAAIGYSLGDFLSAVRGFGYSLRVLFLAFLSAVPVVFAAVLIMSALHSLAPGPGGEEISLNGATVVHLAAASAVTMVLFTAVHASLAFAVGDIIQRRMKEKKPRV